MVPEPDNPTENSSPAEAVLKQVDHLVIPRLQTPARALEPIYESPGVVDVISRYVR